MPGRRQVRRRIGREAAFVDQVAVEAAHRRHATRDAGRRAVAARPVEVAVDVVVGGLRDALAGPARAGGSTVAAKPCRETFEVAPVGGHAVGSQGALEREIVEVVVDGRIGHRSGRAGRHCRRRNAHLVVAAATRSSAWSSR